MKRICALLLSAVILFLLAACGSEAPNPEGPAGTQHETEPPVLTTAPAIRFGIGDSEFADHPYLPDIFGTWEFRENFASSTYTMYQTAEFREDGTCVVDGEAANWRIEDGDTSDHTLYIGIYRNSEIIYGAAFFLDSKYGLVLWPVYWLDGHFAQPNNYVLFVKTEG